MANRYDRNFTPEQKRIVEYDMRQHDRRPLKLRIHDMMYGVGGPCIDRNFMLQPLPTRTHNLPNRAIYRMYARLGLLREQNA